MAVSVAKLAENRADIRIPYAIQWVWPIPIIFVCIFCPESPTWRECIVSPVRPPANLLVVENGREADAENAVRRLQSPSAGVSIPTPQETVALLAQTNAYEKQITEGVGYMECFRGVNLRRTEITVGTWVAQQMCGPVLMTYAIYFFQQAGLAPSQAFNMTLGLVGRVRAHCATSLTASTPSLSSGQSSRGR